MSDKDDAANKAIIERFKAAVVVDGSGNAIQTEAGLPLQADAHVSGLKQDMAAVMATVMTNYFKGYMSENVPAQTKEALASEDKSLRENLVSGEGRPMVDNLVERLIEVAISKRDDPEFRAAAVAFVEMKAASNLMMSYDTLVGPSDNFSYTLNQIEAKSISMEAKLGQASAKAMLYLKEIELNKTFIPAVPEFAVATLGDVTNSLKTMSSSSETGMKVIHAQDSFQALALITPLFQPNVTASDKLEFVEKLDKISEEFKSTGADTSKVIEAIADARSAVVNGDDRNTTSKKLDLIESATALVIVELAMKTTLEYAQGAEVRPFNDGLTAVVTAAIDKYESALDKLGRHDDAEKIFVALQVAASVATDKMEQLLPGSQAVLAGGSDRYPRLEDSDAKKVVFEPIFTQKLQDSGITTADVTGALSELKSAAIAEGRDPARVDEFVAVQALLSREAVLGKDLSLSKQFDSDNQQNRDAAGLSNERSSSKDISSNVPMDSASAKSEAAPRQQEAQLEMSKKY